MRTACRLGSPALILFFLALLLPDGSVLAQDAQEDLAKEAANPIANLMSLPFQNNADYG